MEKYSKRQISQLKDINNQIEKFKVIGFLDDNQEKPVLNNFPIFFDWMIPARFKFLCVLQSSILNPVGSPPPGAKECLINITLFPSCAGFQFCWEEWEWIENRERINTFSNREIILFFTVDEMLVLQIYVASVYMT